jgi:lipopolysaccharide export LptBFGC system permease protein LptF
VITKRHLGIGLILLSLIAVAASFAFDFLGAGQFQGIGPAQRLALIAAGAVFIIGLTLLPLGDRPA